MSEREQKWAVLLADPEWHHKRAETERDGARVSQLDNAFLQRAAFSTVTLSIFVFFRSSGDVAGQ